MKNYIYLLPALLLAWPSQISAQNALDFNPSGSADYVQTTCPGISGSADRSFEAWVYLSGSPSGNTCISDYGTNAVGSRNTFYINANRQLGFISGGTNANLSSSTNAVPLNRWTHVAFVLKNGTGYLYVDAVQVGTGNLSTVNTPVGNTDLRLGQRVAGGSIPFDGVIDEYRIWSVARTRTELMASRNDEFCANPSGLAAYYKLNEGAAGGMNSGINTAIDEVSAANGTLNNFALSGSSSNWVSGASISAGIIVNNLNLTECAGFSIVVGANTYDSSGVYTDTLVAGANNGCDSVINLNLNVAPAIDTTVSVASPTLSANQAGASYQWLDCNNNYAPVPSATGQTFTAAITGRFAVEISFGNCIDTSSCTDLIISGFDLKEQDENQVSIYPNPVKDQLHLEWPFTMDEVQIQILNAQGQCLKSEEGKGIDHLEITLDKFKPGLYFIRINKESYPVIIGG